MLEDRNRQIDIVALLLAAGTLFLVLALGTHHATDSPGGLVWPASEEIENACGWSGAYISHAMLEMMGLGAYYAVASLAVVVAALLLQRQINQPIMRSVGWALSLIGFTTIAAMALRGWSLGPVVGAGGYLGAMGRVWLEGNFAVAGAYIFALSVFLAGLLLCTDYLMFRVVAVATTVGGSGLATVGKLSQAATRCARKRTDLDEAPTLADDSEWELADTEETEDDQEVSEEEIAVRTPDAWDSEEADVEEEHEDLDEDEELEEGVPGAAAAMAAAASGIAAKITSTLTGKKSVEEPASPPVVKTKPKSEREQIIEQLDAADSSSEADPDYELPPLELLLEAEDVSYEEHKKEVRRKAKILERTFESFGFHVRVVEIETGPVIAQYEVELEAGLRLSKITGLADDLAIALRVPSVRIVAPIPGKNTVGIEVPNENRQLVRLRDAIEETNGRAKRMKIPVYLGKDVAGNPMVVDLAALPHLLIAGRTGTGKSVCLNSIIVSILMGRGPDEVRMLMIDPKMVELSGYGKLPHLMHPVVTDMRKAEAILAWAVDKMEERYQMLARAGVRHVSVYNQLSEEELRDRIRPANDAEWSLVPKQLPFIVIVADEMADLMMVAGKDVEQHIIRLAQKSRAVGIHLILATQKPTVDVITGLIKSNLPARIAFQVASRTDSRVVLDEMGADKLLGNGDMLFLSPGTSMLLRGQGTYLSDDEITRVVDYVGTEEQRFAPELMQLKTKEEQEADESGGGGGFQQRDDLYESAVDIVVREGRGSVSLLQRSLGIGYGRAARLIDFMAEDGVVGPYNGSNAREVLMTLDQWEAKEERADPPTGLDDPGEASHSPPAAAGFSVTDQTVPWEDEDPEEEEDEDPEEEEAWEDESSDEEEKGDVDQAEAAEWEKGEEEEWEDEEWEEEDPEEEEEDSEEEEWSESA